MNARTDGRARPPAIVTPRRIVISVALAACVVMIGWAFSQSRTTPRVTYRDAAIVAVYPDVGDLDPQPARIKP